MLLIPQSVGVLANPPAVLHAASNVQPERQDVAGEMSIINSEHEVARSEHKPATKLEQAYREADQSIEHLLQMLAA